jgi:hypothetical protein
MDSEERLSTRDIAGGGDTATDRDPTSADTPPADTAAVPPDRADRDYDDGGAVAAGRAENGDGDVVTDEPAGRGSSRESLADPDAGGAAGDDDAGRPAPAAAAAAGSAAGDPAVRDTAAGDATARDTTADDTATGTAATGTSAAADGDDNPLLADAEGFQGRWEEIQVRFVDEPRGAVEDADALVATVMQRLAEGFAQERERLEAQWGRGEDISTEDLRVALQRYRSFFRRLLST